MTLMLRLNRLILFLAFLSTTSACGLFKIFVPAVQPLWTYSNPNFSPDYGPMSMFDNKLFTYQSGKSNELPIALIALDASSGQELWPPVPDDDLLGFDGIIGGHAIFTGHYGDGVSDAGDVLFPIIAINLASGLEDWRYTGSVYDTGVVSSEKYLFIPKSYSQIDVVDAQTGTVISTFTEEYDPAEILDLNPGWIKYIFTDTSIYSLSPAGVLRQYDVKTTALQKTLSLDMPAYIQSAFLGGDNLYVDSSPEIDGDLHLLAYNLETGQRLWDIASLRGSAFGIDIYNGSDYLDTLNGPSALNLTTGKILWSVPSQLSPFFVGEASNGNLLVTKDQILTAYDPSNGQKVWSYKADLPNIINVNAVDGVAFIISAENLRAFQYSYIPSQLDAIDMKTGKLIWRYEKASISLPIDAGDHVIVEYDGGLSALPVR
jgi:outer membrane protein assembly factor BamB